MNKLFYLVVLLLTIFVGGVAFASDLTCKIHSPTNHKICLDSKQTNACKDKKPTGGGCKHLGLACCPGRHWKAEVCGCVDNVAGGGSGVVGGGWSSYWGGNSL